MAPRNEERRREILASTYSLLDEASYDRVSLNDIARGAGIKKSLLQRYFPQKIDIIKEMLTTLLDALFCRSGRRLSNVSVHTGYGSFTGDTGCLDRYDLQLASQVYSEQTVQYARFALCTLLCDGGLHAFVPASGGAWN